MKHWRIQHKYFFTQGQDLEVFNILLLWTVTLTFFHVTVLPLFQKSNVIHFVRLSFPLFFFLIYFLFPYLSKTQFLQQGRS